MSIDKERHNAVDLVLSILRQNTNQSIYLCSQGGGGKTTVLLEIARRLTIDPYSEDKTFMIPLFIPAKELEKKSNYPIKQYISTKFVDNYGQEDIEVVYGQIETKLFNSPESKYRYIVIIDAINEYYQPSKLEFEISSLMNCKNTQVIISSRNLNDTLATNLLRIQLKPLSRGILHKKVGLIEDKELLSLLSMPFYLSLYCSLSNPARTSYNDYQLIDCFVSQTKDTILCSNSNVDCGKDSFKRTTDVVTKSILPDLAFNNLMDSKLQSSISSFREIAESNGCTNLNELLDIVHCTGMVFEDGDVLTWTHQIYRDFFAATYLYKNIISLLDKLKALDSPEATEILDLYYNAFDNKEDFKRLLSSLNEAVSSSRTWEWKSKLFLNKNLVYLYSKLSPILRGVDLSERDLSVSEFEPFTKILNCNLAFSNISHASFPYLKGRFTDERKDIWALQGRKAKKIEIVAGRIMLLNRSNTLIHIDLYSGSFNRTPLVDPVKSSQFGQLDSTRIYVFERFPLQHKDPLPFESESEQSSKCYVCIYDLAKYGGDTYPFPDKYIRFPFGVHDIIRSFAKDGKIIVSTPVKDYVCDEKTGEITETVCIYNGHRYLPLFSEKEAFFTIYEPESSGTNINVTEESENDSIIEKTSDGFKLIDPISFLSDNSDLFYQMLSLNDSFPYSFVEMTFQMNSLNLLRWGKVNYHMYLSATTESDEEVIIVDVGCIPNSDVVFVLFYNKGDIKSSSERAFWRQIRIGILDLYTRVVTELKSNTGIVCGFVKNTKKYGDGFLAKAIHNISYNIEDHYLFLYGPHNIYSLDIVDYNIKELFHTDQVIISVVLDEYGMTVVTENSIFHLSNLTKYDNSAAQHDNDPNAYRLIDPGKYCTWKIDMSSLKITPLFINWKPYYIINKKSSRTITEEFEKCWLYNAATKEIITDKDNQKILFVENDKKVYSLIGNWIVEIESKLLKKKRLFSLNNNESICGTFIENGLMQFLVCEQIYEGGVLNRRYYWVRNTNGTWLEATLFNDTIFDYDKKSSRKQHLGMKAVGQCVKLSGDCHVCYMDDNWIYAFTTAGELLYKQYLDRATTTDLILCDCSTEAFLIPNEEEIPYDFLDYFSSVLNEKRIYKYSCGDNCIQEIENRDLRSKVYYLHGAKRLIVSYSDSYQKLNNTSCDIYFAKIDSGTIIKDNHIGTLRTPFLHAFQDDAGNYRFIIEDRYKNDCLIEIGIDSPVSIRPFSQQMSGTHTKEMKQSHRKLPSGDLELLKLYGAIE